MLRAAALDSELEAGRVKLQRLEGVEGELVAVRAYYHEAVERLASLQDAHDRLQTKGAEMEVRLL